MTRIDRAALALLLLALVWPAAARAAAHAVLGWAAGHTPVVLVAAAAVLLLRSLPGAHRAVTRLAGPRAARVLAGGGRS